MNDKIQTFLEESLYEDENILMADGFDDAFIGIGSSFNSVPVAVYDRDKCIDILCKDMTYDEAQEYFEYNVIGAYVGEKTPFFIKKID